MDSINNLRNEAKKRLQILQNEEELRSLEVEFLGRQRGKLTAILRSVKALPESDRMKLGRDANEFRQSLIEEIRRRRAFLSKSAMEETLTKERIDVTVPGVQRGGGHLHPLSLLRRQAEEIFSSLGFEIADGPELETEHYNLDALNIPKDHPARDMWDTFWIETPRARIKERPLLRTQTSTVQIHFMESRNPPFRIVAPGTVYRHEATDASHDIQFMQLEGLMVDRKVSVANLKAVLLAFLQRMVSPSVEIRFRPSYFPFVEPGFEVDMRMPRGKWMEMLGAGMVHQNVFSRVGYVRGAWTGFAFGIGFDRLVMMKYKIPDVRLLRSGDVRFLRQF